MTEKFKPLRPKITYEDDSDIINELENSKEVDKDDSDVDYDEQHWDDIPTDD